VGFLRTWGAPGATQVQLDSIRAIGVDLAQGFLFGKPMSSEVATGYLESAKLT
jgi:EAL domain-containing protein (putative c-di-GMP-specific phosphodiesterase class I)